LGDTLEGFQLTEISPQKVVFQKGSSTFEVMLDFSRNMREEKKVSKARGRPRRLPRDEIRRKRREASRVKARQKK
jgi:hypothetical protein